MAPEGTDFDNPMQRSRVGHCEAELKYTHTHLAVRYCAAVVILFVVSHCQKWQRRFFVLYEHGSLSFALDELVSNCSDSETTTPIFYFNKTYIR